MITENTLVAVWSSSYRPSQPSAGTEFVISSSILQHKGVFTSSRDGHVSDLAAKLCNAALCCKRRTRFARGVQEVAIAFNVQTLLRNLASLTLQTSAQ